MGKPAAARTGGASGGQRSEVSNLTRIFGTDEPPQHLRRFQLGQLSLEYAGGSIRRIKWRGAEVVRSIAWPVRDENWGTYDQEILEEEISETSERVLGRLKFSVAAGRLVGRLKFEATRTGEISARLALTPTAGDFATNRAGLTVLHPILELSGSPLTVRHDGGEVESTSFPQMVSPSQPVMDIGGLAYKVGSAVVRIDFDGEVFEMEDQRNWSDASFKTYCVPLKHPFTYVIDREITQSVSISARGGASEAMNTSSRSTVEFEQTDQAAPSLGLALEEGWLPIERSWKSLANCGARHLLARVEPETGSGFLRRVAELAAELSADIDVELVLDDARPPRESLASFAKEAEDCGLSPDRLIALPRAYLASHQPSGPWPAGPTPDEVIEAAREVFPDTPLGGGMLTNFTEFNRCPPNPENCDYITHGSSAIVHASDDLSVIETLEALPHIFSSATQLGAANRYRLGLVSIGMRSNPYGAGVAANLEQVRTAMAQADPRHRGLFGAAWAVGVLGTTIDSSVEALCLAAPTGPFGISYEPQEHTQPGFDVGIGSVYPLYHVLSQAGQLSGANRLRFNGLSPDLAGYGAVQNGSTVAMIANLSNRTAAVDLEREAAVKVLDTASFDAAVGDINWFRNRPARMKTAFNLEPFAVGFLHMQT